MRKSNLETLLNIREAHQLLSDGVDPKQIAVRLGVSVATVKRYLDGQRGERLQVAIEAERTRSKWKTFAFRKK